MSEAFKPTDCLKKLLNCFFPKQPMFKELAFTQRAWVKMITYAHLAGNLEISGYGRIVDGKVIDVKLTEQEVESARVSATAESQINFIKSTPKDQLGQWILDWHSHVDMGAYANMEIMNIKESLEFFNKMKEALDDGHESVKLAYVDTITVKNVITKKNMVMNDIYFFASNGNSGIHFIRSIQDVKEKKLYKIHNDLEHVNISDSYNTYVRTLTIDGVTSEYLFNVAPFCNPITGHSLYNNTDTYTKLLKGFLYQQNHNSRYRSPQFIDIEATFP